MLFKIPIISLQHDMSGFLYVNALYRKGVGLLPSYNMTKQNTRQNKTKWRNYMENINMANI